MKADTLLYVLIGALLGGLGMYLFAGSSSAGRQTVLSGGMMDMDDHMSMSMEDMSVYLKNKSGDDFDETFLSQMIDHHQGAIDMANLAKTNAKHDEIKKLADEIIAAQKKEIQQMRQWQNEWGY